MTLRLQITIALGMLAAVAAVSAALFSYTSVDQRLHAETDTFLDDRISLVLSFVATRSQLADAGSELPFEPDIANPSPAGSLTRYDVELQFLRADGSIAAATSASISAWMRSSRSDASCAAEERRRACACSFAAAE